MALNGTAMASVEPVLGHNRAEPPPPEHNRRLQCNNNIDFCIEVKRELHYICVTISDRSEYSLGVCVRRPSVGSALDPLDQSRASLSQRLTAVKPIGKYCLKS